MWLCSEVKGKGLGAPCRLSHGRGGVVRAGNARARSRRARGPIEADTILACQGQAVIQGLTGIAHVPIGLANSVDAARAFAKGVGRTAVISQVSRMNADAVLALEADGAGSRAGLPQRRPDLADTGRGLTVGHANQIALAAVQVGGAQLPFGCLFDVTDQRPVCERDTPEVGAAALDSRTARPRR